MVSNRSEELFQGNCSHWCVGGECSACICHTDYIHFPAGCEPVIIELQRRGDELVTDVGAIAAAVERLGADAIVAVMTTTSCFAPRACDDVVSVAKLCDASKIPHVINHAYGLQVGTRAEFHCSLFLKLRDPLSIFQ